MSYEEQTTHWLLHEEHGLHKLKMKQNIHFASDIAVADVARVGQSAH